MWEARKTKRYEIPNPFLPKYGNFLYEAPLINTMVVLLKPMQTNGGHGHHIEAQTIGLLFWFWHKPPNGFVTF